MVTAKIFDIERNSFVDGPGIRTTVFFKGCNLKCKWCHNPESQSADTQMMFYKDKCTGCGKCAEVCPNKLEKCDFCGKCALFCPSDARQICGKDITPDELIRELTKDKYSTKHLVVALLFQVENVCFRLIFLKKY